MNTATKLRTFDLGSSLDGILSQVGQLKFGRPRFIISTDSNESDAFMCFEFAQKLFNDFNEIGIAVKAYFLMEDGKREDITDLFI
jgi:hypothetical protein